MDISTALEIIFEKKPNFQKLYQNSGHESVHDFFAKQLSESRGVNTDATRLLAAETERIIGPSAAENLEKYLNTYSLAHTADHMGMLNHPFFWFSKAAYGEVLPKDNKVILVLAMGGISPNNSSLPRSLTWNDKKTGEYRASFVPLSRRQRSIYGIPALQDKEWETWLNKYNFPENLRVVFTQITKRAEISNFQWLSEQLTFINYHWWRELFGESETLLYLEAESLAGEYITEQLKNNASNLFSLLQKPEITHQYLSSFENIPGAHSQQPERGSQLFWLIDAATDKRLSLRYHSGKFVASGGVEISLTVEEIASQLENKTLLPTMALTYCILSFELGLTLTGGFSQIDYLPKMAAAWRAIFPDALIPDTTLFGGEITLLSMANSGGESPGASAADLFIHTESVKERLEMRKDMVIRNTMKNAIESSAKELLRVVEPTLDITTLKPVEAAVVLGE